MRLETKTKTENRTRPERSPAELSFVFTCIRDAGVHVKKGGPGRQVSVPPAPMRVQEGLLDVALWRTGTHTQWYVGHHGHWLGMTPGGRKQQTKKMLEAQPPIISRIRMGQDKVKLTQQMWESLWKRPERGSPSTPKLKEEEAAPGGWRTWYRPSRNHAGNARGLWEKEHRPSQPIIGKSLSPAKPGAGLQGAWPNTCPQGICLLVVKHT